METFFFKYLIAKVLIPENMKRASFYKLRKIHREKEGNIDFSGELVSRLPKQM